MLAHRLDALIVATCQPDSSMLRRIQAGETPLVLIDRHFDGFASHYIGTDDYTAGKLAAEHLVGIGCKRIAHVRGAENSTGRRRYKGFLDTLHKHGRTLPPDYLVAARSVDVEGARYGAAALNQLTALKQPPDGVFCYNDVVAVGAVQAAVAAGIRIPADIAVIGCGNLHYDSVISVPLSSIDQRSGEIGARAAKMILDLLRPEAPQDYNKIVLQPKLIARASTLKPSAKPAAKKKSAAK
jgi:LacI family transcriptional regulator